MNKPYWQIKHDWFISDIRILLWEIWTLKKLLRQYAEESLGDILRQTIKKLKKELAGVVKEYANIYGDKPDITVMRREVENANQ